MKILKNIAKSTACNLKKISENLGKMYIKRAAAHLNEAISHNCIIVFSNFCTILYKLLITNYNYKITNYNYKKKPKNLFVRKKKIQAVTHPSTNQTQRRLPSPTGREAMFSTCSDR